MSYRKITKLSPCVSTGNIGDFIIDEYCQNILDELFDTCFYVCEPTHEKLCHLSFQNITSSDFSFICGTNLLNSHMRKYKQWNLSLSDVCSFFFFDYPKKALLSINKLRNNINRKKAKKPILFGVGWWQYQDLPDTYTKSLLKLFLSDKYTHSVRDGYTENMLRAAGIENVVNTACPTMWNLTDDFCCGIPKKKSSTVVTTLTDYNIDEQSDLYMMDTLLRNYDKVYVWLQSPADYHQLMNSRFCEKIHVIPPTLRDYDRFLCETDSDYIGTRLHGGIRALNFKHRSLIIAVDNRAVEISKDTNLPVILRTNISEQLETRINCEDSISIHLPTENICRWKSQFH